VIFTGGFPLLKRIGTSAFATQNEAGIAPGFGSSSSKIELLSLAALEEVADTAFYGFMGTVKISGAFPEFALLGARLFFNTTGHTVSISCVASGGLTLYGGEWDSFSTFEGNRTSDGEACQCIDACAPCWVSVRVVDNDTCVTTVTSTTTTTATTNADETTTTTTTTTSSTSSTTAAAKVDETTAAVTVEVSGEATLTVENATAFVESPESKIGVTRAFATETGVLESAVTVTLSVVTRRLQGRSLQGTSVKADYVITMAATSEEEASSRGSEVVSILQSVDTTELAIVIVSEIENAGGPTYAVVVEDFAVDPSPKVSGGTSEDAVDASDASLYHSTAILLLLCSLHAQ